MGKKEKAKVKPPKKKKQKTLMTGMRRRIYTAVGCLLLIGSMAAGITFLPPETTRVEVPEYTYQTTAEASYRVKLLPNEIFAEEWLGEDELYSTKLTDMIEVTFKADFAGGSKEAVSGGYTVTAILEGYEERQDVPKVIYKRNFPIKKGTVSGDDKGGAGIQAVVNVRTEPYKEAIALADNTFGTTTATRFYLLFEGSFTSDTIHGKVEETFSLAVHIPIPNQDGFYEISKPAPFSEKGQIVSEEVVVGPSPTHALLIALWAALALALVIWAQFLTRKPNPEEAYALQWKELFRKYGSRMIQLEQVDSKWTEGAGVSGMDNLVMLSEELHQPICYSLDEKGLPKEGLLYVPDGQKGYVLCLQGHDTTPLVVG